MEKKRHDSQRQLFPQNFELNAADTQVLLEILPDINNLGFDIQEVGKNSFVIHGFTADILQGNEKQILEELIEQFKTNLSVTKISKRENLAKAIAHS